MKATAANLDFKQYAADFFLVIKTSQLQRLMILGIFGLFFLHGKAMSSVALSFFGDRPASEELSTTARTQNFLLKQSSCYHKS